MNEKELVEEVKNALLVGEDEVDWVELGVLTWRLVRQYEALEKQVQQLNEQIDRFIDLLAELEGNDDHT